MFYIGLCFVVIIIAMMIRIFRNVNKLEERIKKIYEEQYNKRNDEDWGLGPDEYHRGN